MDPEQASSKVREGRRDDRILVCFFGDNEYGWNPADWLVPFQEHYAEKRLQKGTKGHRVWCNQHADHSSSPCCPIEHLDVWHVTYRCMQQCLPKHHHIAVVHVQLQCNAHAQKFHRAVEEAKEVQDRRSGLQPETNHEPVDFLDPSTFPSSESEDDSRDDSLAPTADLRIPPLRKDDAAHVVPIQALNFLMAAACGDSIALNKVNAHLLTSLQQKLHRLHVESLELTGSMWRAQIGAESAKLCRQLLASLAAQRLLAEDNDASLGAKQRSRAKPLLCHLTKVHFQALARIIYSILSACHFIVCPMRMMGTLELPKFFC